MAHGDPLPPLPVIDPGRYRHYKGADYEVIGVARHSESLEPLVVYRPLYGEGALWVRPFEMFTGTVELDGCRVARFARVCVPRGRGPGTGAPRDDDPRQGPDMAGHGPGSPV